VWESRKNTSPYPVGSITDFKIQYGYQFKNTGGSRDTHGTHTGHAGTQGHTVTRITQTNLTTDQPVWLLSQPRIWSGGKNVRGHACALVGWDGCEIRLCVLRFVPCER
jgi:hypothetical protein